MIRLIIIIAGADHRYGVCVLGTSVRVGVVGRKGWTGMQTNGDGKGGREGKKDGGDGEGGRNGGKDG